ncbi:MAG: hypothetical protein A3F84_14250 [Candidatus Handelsmanbacteria bacterium RIFCSPLOWO2_12_FULL_64_10]|uniref:Uncharacterized protein n=1 Tax=Handelsmanbacteria sp. (strain RIFCSPLOWO2_12_FULL_64_10) TaxID=1817868 RepID=A0A1F6CIA8_HANXR|nr:MAG: hypothetical protein A3F84_14250 [Candidatus Handelsmanbacteria bacterium RIFCSPLOWO2_12_FULL_64_10]
MKGQTPAIKDILEEVDIACAICHNPHSNANSKQVRFEGETTLSATQPGSNTIAETTVRMGVSATCARCHHLRTGSDRPGTRLHESHQTEMIFGMGGYHYPNETYPSGGHRHIQNVCATCHMAIPARTDLRYLKLGSHTWKMYEDNGTPDYPTDDLYNTVGCEQCHGPMPNFNVNGAQTEIHGLLRVLYDLLPKRKDAPVGGWKFPAGVAWAYSATATTSATRQMTPEEVNAAYNYLFVEQDLSEGAHNAPYARKLLADAIKSLRPRPTAALAGDFNGDNRVDFEDLFLFVAAFGTTTASPGWDARYDLSGSGTVGYVDWYIFLDNFGKTAGSARPVFVEDGRNTKVGFDIGQTALQAVDNRHFAVQVQVSNAADLRGYGVTLAYNPEELEFIRVLRSEGSLVKAEGTLAPVTVVSNEPGRLVIADAVTGNRTASGSGPLAEVVFQRKGVVLSPMIKVEAAQVSDGNFGMNRTNGALAAEETAPTAVYALSQNFPNPFNPATQIGFSLAEEGRIRLVVYNLLGQVVRDLVDDYRTSGSHTVTWDGKDAAGRIVASGIYLYRIEANRFSAVRRMVVVK